MAAFELVIDGETFVVEVGDVSRSPVTVRVNGVEKTVSFREVAPEASASTREVSATPVVPTEPAEPAAAAPAPTPAGAVSGEVIAAPMPGKILSVSVDVGDAVSEGDTVCTLEAMKMEMPISATASGTVQAVHVRVGQNVAYNDPLITVG